MSEEEMQIISATVSSVSITATKATGGIFEVLFFLKRWEEIIRLCDVISKAIQRSCHDCCQTQASLPASQRAARPRIPLPTFPRWIPLVMPSVCLSPECHVHRLDQVIAAGKSQASAVLYSCESSSPVFVLPCFNGTVFYFQVCCMFFWFQLFYHLNDNLMGGGGVLLQA